MLRVLALSLGFGLVVVAAQPPAGVPRCATAGPVVPIPELPEASGVAVSAVPGRLWAHNDSGRPILMALDTRGSVVRQVRVSGAPVQDWEAVAVGRCPSGSCLYLGDIGDNQGRRKRITVYRAPEPGNESSITVREAFHGTYPDGPHDAETLLVTREGGLFIVTKGGDGPIGLYRFPRELRPGAIHALEHVSAPLEPSDGGSKRRAGAVRITDGAVSADGQWVVLRTGQALMFYRAADFLAGNWREAGRFNLRRVKEAQGEGVSMGPDGSVYLTGEGGGKARPGTFAQLVCTVS